MWKTCQSFNEKTLISEGSQFWKNTQMELLKVEMSQAVLSPNLTKNSNVPNCCLEILMCHVIRWFECKLKPPKS